MTLARIMERTKAVDSMQHIRCIRHRHHYLQLWRVTGSLVRVVLWGGATSASLFGHAIRSIRYAIDLLIGPATHSTSPISFHNNAICKPLAWALWQLAEITSMALPVSVAA